MSNSEVHFEERRDAHTSASQDVSRGARNRTQLNTELQKCSRIVFEIAENIRWQFDDKMLSYSRGTTLLPKVMGQYFTIKKRSNFLVTQVEGTQDAVGQHERNGTVIGLKSDGVVAGRLECRFPESVMWTVEGRSILRGAPWDLRPESTGTITYRSCVMRHAYLAQDRGDSGELVMCLARSMATPTPGALRDLKKVTRCLKVRRHLALRFKQQIFPKCITAFADSDHAGWQLTRRSTTEMVK